MNHFFSEHVTFYSVSCPHKILNNNVSVFLGKCASKNNLVILQNILII